MTDNDLNNDYLNRDPNTRSTSAAIKRLRVRSRNLKEDSRLPPILVHPDSKAQFIVEVDASNVGVGAILSLRSAGDSRVHPCAFYSHRLFPAEQNYDIGNKELLAVKLALEEWRQWLEGAQVPFQVWIDHKNLGITYKLLKG